MFRRDTVGSRRWQVADGPFDPDHSIHSQRIIRGSLVSCNTSIGSIPGGHGGVVVVVQAWFYQFELDAAPRCNVQRECLQVQKVVLIRCCLEGMGHGIVVLPGDGCVRQHRQDKGLEEILGRGNGYRRQ